MNPNFAIPAIGFLAFGTNLPLGRWRAKLRRFSPAWFLAVHASIPLIAGARILLGVGWVWFPVFVGLAVAGQIIGGRRRREDSGDR